LAQPIRSYKILVVEDNPGDANLIREAFSECGHRCDVQIVSRLTEARAALEQQTFDILISDMGVRNGESNEFLRWARSRNETSRMPIVVLSGAVDPNPSYDAGANAFISKPGNVDQFFSKVRSLMEFWVNVAELPQY
jgi:CheY-like chemotaxis protein